MLLFYLPGFFTLRRRPRHFLLASLISNSRWEREAADSDKRLAGVFFVNTKENAGLEALQKPHNFSGNPALVFFSLSFTAPRKRSLDRPKQTKETLGGGGGVYLDEGDDKHGEHGHGKAQQVEERQRDEGLVGVEHLVRVAQDVDGERRQRHLAAENQTLKRHTDTDTQTYSRSTTHVDIGFKMKRKKRGKPRTS